MIPSCAFAQVQKHLSKLFDNMAKMRFETDGEGNPSKIGQGMYSKEEEYVPFNQSCDCSGQVKRALDIIISRWIQMLKTLMVFIFVTYC